MEEEIRTLVQAVEAFEPAQDVTDLDTARRLITALREQIAQTAEEHEFSDDEYHLFLGSEYDRMLRLLHQHHWLLGDPSDGRWMYADKDEVELEEAFEMFVKDSLEVAWDTAQLEMRFSVSLDEPTLSA